MTVIKTQLRECSWGGNGATLERLKATKIIVPTTFDSAGESVVDWDGIFEFGRELFAEIHTPRSAICHERSHFLYSVVPEDRCRARAADAVGNATACRVGVSGAFGNRGHGSGCLRTSAPAYGWGASYGREAELPSGRRQAHSDL